MLNTFVSKCLNKDPPQAQPMPKEQAKGRKTKPEVIHETFQLALEAAHKCTKCEPTTRGSKGCSSCMGKWFDEKMRINAAPIKFLKAIGIDPKEGQTPDEGETPDKWAAAPLYLEPKVQKSKKQAKADKKDAKKILKSFTKIVKSLPMQ